MKERPMLMSAPMVRAILAGTKTQTRRAVKGVDPDEHPIIWGSDDRCGKWAVIFADAPGTEVISRVEVTCPYGVPGDLLWVREGCWIYGQWSRDGVTKSGRPRWRFEAIGQRVLYENPGHEQVAYLGKGPGWSRRNSIHMPRWASRITLRITDVRVERLQDISEGDALAEGIERIRFPGVGEWGWPQRKYRELWESINGDGSWAANPFVWCVSFERVDPSAPADRATG
jgi:hypothetical protein